MNAPGTEQPSEESARDQAALAAALDDVNRYRELAAHDPETHLAALSATVFTLIEHLAYAGQPEVGPQVWDQCAVGMTPENVEAWRVLQAAWNWMSSPDYEHEQARMSLHARVLLAPENEKWVLEVLRYQSDADAQRATWLLKAARQLGVDGAYESMLDLIQQANAG